MSAWKDIALVLEKHKKNKRKNNKQSRDKSNGRSIATNKDAEKNTFYNKTIRNDVACVEDNNKPLNKTARSKSVNNINNSKYKARNPTYLSAPTKEQLREASNAKLKKSTSEKHLHEDRTLRTSSEHQNKTPERFQPTQRNLPQLPRKVSIHSPLPSPKNPDVLRIDSFEHEPKYSSATSIVRSSEGYTDHTVSSDTVQKISSKCSPVTRGSSGGQAPLGVTQNDTQQRGRGRSKKGVIPLWRKLLSRSDNSLAKGFDSRNSEASSVSLEIKAALNSGAQSSTDVRFVCV